METNPPENSTPEDARQRLAALERAFADAEHRAQKYAQERDAAWTQRKILQQESHQLQRDYASLRLQKGGFGFKSLLFAGMVGTFLGFGICYWLLRTTERNTDAFHQFRDQHQFSLELAISQGAFAQVDSLLKVSLEQPVNAQIRPELEFTRKIAGAAWRRCEQ